MGFRGRDLLRRASRIDRQDRDISDPVDIDRKVVLIEGVPGKYRALEQALVPLGFDSVTVGSEGNALEVIGRDKPSLVLSSVDLEARGLEGYQLCYWEGEKPPVPLVYVRASERVTDDLGEKVGQALRFLGEGQGRVAPSPEPARDDSGAANAADAVGTESPVSDQPQRDRALESEQSESESAAEGHLIFSEVASAEDIIQGFREVGGESLGLGEKRAAITRTMVSEETDVSFKAFGIRPPEPEERELKGTLEELREEFRAMNEPRRERSEEESPRESVDHIFEQFLRVEQEVRDGEGSGKSPVEPLDVSPETTAAIGGSAYQRALSYVLRSIRAFNEGEHPDLRMGESLVGQFVSSLRQGKTLLLKATARDQEFSVSGHSVNVTILALKLAEILEWNADKVHRVGLAALIHEIGVTRLPTGLTYNESPLAKDELSLLRRRPAFSVQLLGGAPPEYDWLATVVGQVYEREDGSGYPLGLKGNEISEEAKVIGLADFFESCIHIRPYRAPLTGYQTLFELTTDHAACFADRIVKALIKGFSLYPYNECVVLDNGEIGRVIDINPEKLSRPIVDILFDDENTLTVEPRIVDLAVESERYISKAISLQALPF
jgi:HD-GYP domain-containing protein (c-di-GMP phosphodiesterase class II)